MQKSLDVLRDRTSDTPAFRKAANDVCNHLVRRTKRALLKNGIEPAHVVVIIILRAAVAFLDVATRAFPEAPVGVLGLKRDEQTLKPHWYYENLPTISKNHTLIIFDPMLATGGSVEAVVKRLVKRGADPKNIHFVGIIASPEGYERLAKRIPQNNITLAAVDRGLDERGMIVPGIGDFGDRYFGYVGRAIIG